MVNTPQGQIWDIDRALMLTLNGSWGTGWDIFWWVVTQPWFWTPLFVAALWLMWRQMGWRGMLIAFGFVVVGLALADQTAGFFKTHTPKFRPIYTTLPWGGVPYNSLIHAVSLDGHVFGSFGTVSGHAATAMAIGLTSACIVRRRWFWWAVGAYVVLTSFSRIYLGVHFPLDVLFGLTAGTLIGLAMVWLWNRVNKKCRFRTKAAGYAAILVLVLPAAGCGDGATRSGAIPTFDLERAIDNPQRFDLSDIAKDIALIPLDDSVPEALLGDIGSIRGTADRFYIRDSGRSPIKVFDEAGRFVGTRGRFGRGPGEITDIMHFAADYETDNLYLGAMASNMKSSVIAFDAAGNEFARDTAMVGSMAFHAGELVAQRSAMVRVESADAPTAGVKKPLLDIFTPQLQRTGGVESVERGHPFIIHNRGGGLFNVRQGPASVLTAGAKTLLVKEALCDTVYSYRSGGVGDSEAGSEADSEAGAEAASSNPSLEPAFVLDAGDYTIPANALGINPSAEPGHSYVVQGVMESDDYLFVEAYGYKFDTWVRLIFDRDDPSKCISAVDGAGRPGFFIDGIKFTPMYVRAGRLVGFISSFALAEAAGKDALTRPDLRALAAKQQEDSNPIIVVATLKK